MSTSKYNLRKQRHGRVKAKIRRGSSRTRLLVFRSINNNYAQLIDDQKGIIIASSSDMKLKGTKMERAKKVGEEISKKAQENKITEVVFDRNGYKYHGRIKAIAESAREAGLKF